MKLQIENLEAGYSGMEILRGVSIEIENSEIVAIIGPNGSGKSTILKSVFGLADIYDGKINFGNMDVTKLKTFELIGAGLCFVPQGRQVFSSMTVLENIEMGAFTVKDQESVNRSIKTIFQKFPHLEKRKGEIANNLSGDQQQLLAIAMSLVRNLKLLLLDEPSLGLDQKAMKELFANIIEIRDAGTAILMVEQNAKQAIKIADKTYLLENGKIALEGGKELLNNEKIKKIYLGSGAGLV